MLFSALLLAQILPVIPTATPTPTPSPATTSRRRRAAAGDVIDVDAGGSNSYLNKHQQRWESGYAGATFAAPSGFKIRFDALNDVRFGVSTNSYVLGTSIPTHRPNGVFDFAYAVSPHNDVIPTTAVIAGYDLRSGGGWGYQVGYVARSFSSASAANYGFGVDRHWKRQSLGYFVSLSTISKHAGVGVVQGLRWSTDLPSDTVTLTSGVGRGVESTGRNQVAAHETFGIDAGDLHWMDPHTAIRFDLGYFSVSKAYQRFFVLLGMRLRIGRI